MQRVMIQLDGHDLVALDNAAGEEGVSRAAFAREAIRAALAERRRAEELARTVAAYRDRPPESLVVSRARLRRVWPE